ncbi:hypothetical protein [Microbacterium hydrocarbonoxydans]|uniref:Uncharacterized protein n=1 Tax=Microbacterium hydrocarbonoxydans TaxID=273678 RepID=A0A1H4MED0_9MICO|nr:hypothetical protein [Microbacterium hydrocarbonoxydans]SEB81084.1 hypothetical protein SAMN04489807_2109 [Microbacterium hydrocarbonoxydans]
MTIQTYPRTFHVLTSGLTVTLGEWDANVLYRGQTFTVTEEQYEFTKDKRGASWLDLTEEEQVARWGHQKFSTGPAPDGMEVGFDDSTVLYRRRENAVFAARKLTDPVERAEAFKAIERKYGRPQSTQRSVAY